jgi:dihydrofolate reductase
VLLVAVLAILRPRKLSGQTGVGTPASSSCRWTQPWSMSRSTLLEHPPSASEGFEMRKLSVSTLVTLDGVIQDPGGFGETEQGGWGNPYFTEDAQQEAYEHLMASDCFLCGRVTYELLSTTWAKIKGGPYLDRMNSIPKLVASRTLTEPLEWNATLIKGDVAEEIARLKQEPGKDIEMYGSAALMQTLMAHDLIDEYRIWVHPFVIGGGKRLFTEGGHSSRLRLVSTKTLSSGVVILTYTPATTPAE